jgi:hypothetical protein
MRGWNGILQSIRLGLDSERTLHPDPGAVKSGRCENGVKRRRPGSVRQGRGTTSRTSSIGSPTLSGVVEKNGWAYFAPTAYASRRA